jgi:homocitrate synthase NifV
LDSTLRDGEQAPGISFTDDQKLRIAEALDGSGVYEIEAGVPAAGQREKQLLVRLMERRRTALVSVWSRLIEADVRHCLDVRPDLINLSLPMSDLQVYKKLRKDRKWLIGQLGRCLELVAGRQVALSVGFEDAFRAEPSFMLTVARMLRDFGAVRIRLSDTVGIASPSQCRSLVTELSHGLGLGLDAGSELELEADARPSARLENKPVSGLMPSARLESDAEDSIALGFHGHNDLGMALANTVEAAKSGCLYADVTVGGIGERAGNCDLTKLVESSSELFDWGMTVRCAQQLQQQLGEICVIGERR